jgi:hypothetical protein
VILRLKTVLYMFIFKHCDVYLVQELGLIRKPASFMTSICDERGQELNYAGMLISDVSSSSC